MEEEQKEVATETTTLQPTLSKEELEKIEKENKTKFAVDKLKEIQELLNYLEKAHGRNRHERKQFRRELISSDRFMTTVIDTVIKFYESKNEK